MSSQVTLDFINCLREAQIQLYKEDSMNEVESISVKSQTELIINLFNKSRINQKEFFFLINRIISPTFNESLSNSASDLDPNNITSSPIQSRSIIEICRFVLAFQNVDPSKNEKRKIEDQKRLFADILTFSIIPSYFNFFWTEYSIKSLFKFFTCLDKISNDVFYDLIARIGFSTPYFLHFSELCFQSVFSELVFPNTNIKNINKKRLIQKIKCNVKKYQNFIPDETLVVLACSSDPLRTLINSYFTVALSSPIASQAFGFFHFSCKPSKDALNFLKSMFDMKHHNSYVKSFMDAIINCDYVTESNETKPSRYKEIINMYSELFKNSSNFDEKLDEQQELNDYQIKINECPSSSLDSNNIILESTEEETAGKRKLSRIESLPVDLFQNNEISFDEIQPIQNNFNLFSLSDIYNAQEIFQIKFLSTLDIEMIKFASGKLSKFSIPEKIEYYSDSKAGPTKFSKMTIDEKTMLNQVYIIAPMIRHLLQKADLIPFFQRAPPQMTYYNFLYTYLVRRGDLSYLTERATNFDQMMLFFPNQKINPKTIKDSLLCTTFARMKKIKALSTFASIELKIKYLDASSQKQIESTQIVKEVNDKFFTQFKQIRQPSEYTRSPNLFVTDYKSLFQKCNEIPESNSMKYLQKAVFTILSEKTDLYTFISYREKLKKFSVPLKEYDEKFNNDSNSHLLSFVKEYFPRVKKSQISLSPSKDSSNPTPMPTTSGFNKNDYIGKKIMGVAREKRDIIETMNEAFIESSLMRKVDLISLALTNFQKFLDNDYPPNKGGLGSDEYTPAFAALIILCNPQMTVSNYAYLHDLTTGDLPLTEILGGYVSTIPIYLRIAVEYIIPELANKPPFLLNIREEE